MDQVSNILIKVVYNNYKFKHSIENINSTFLELKNTLCLKVQQAGHQIEPDQIICADEDDFQIADNELLKAYLKENSIVKLLPNLNKPKQESSVILADDQIQHQMELNERAQELQEQMDMLKLQKKEDPLEAIVVVFDISGSMNECFQKMEDPPAILNRFGAVNAIFSAFADKTLAFELNHLVKLVCFSSSIQDKCEFISDFNQFIKLVDGSNVGGGTKCFDALFYAVGSLIEIKKKYPNIITRIIALTDGEDNQSQNSAQTVANFIRKNKIILDSFVVGGNCYGLKNITHASGGRCYKPGDINSALKLFENETILSVRMRPQQEISAIEDIDINQFKDQPFDTEGLQVVKNEAVAKSVIDIAQLIKNQEAQQNNQQNQQQQGGGGQQVSFGGGVGPRQKRVLKELNEILKDPSDLFKVYPTHDDIGTWKVLLKGAKGSPYQDGIFFIMVKTPQDYPFKPPDVRFETKIYHCNINQQGRICLDVLKDQWSPALTIAKIMLSLQNLMSSPNPDDALDSTVASVMKHEPEDFKKTVKEYIEKYAKLSAEDLARLVLGDAAIQNDAIFQEKKKELELWLN